MNKESRKLTLSKETLRSLDERELTEVTGGRTGICVNTVVCKSGVCKSAVCNSAAVCQTGIICS
jgi:hypothetical protein